MNSGTIPIFKELSRSFLQIVDSDRTSLNRRNMINPVTAIYLNTEIPGVVSIEKLLEIITLETPPDETILVSLLIPPHLCFPFYSKMRAIIYKFASNLRESELKLLCPRKPFQNCTK
jgi:hypothetical protein